MTVLSHVAIDPRRRESWSILASPQEMHALVARATGGQGRPLWRLDTPATGAPQLLIVSDDEPDWAAFDLVRDEQPESRPYEPFLSRLQAGQQWRFRVALNPTTSLPAEGGARGKVVPVKTRDQVDWFRGRAGSWGFSVAEGEGDVDTVGSVVEKFLRRDQRVTLTVTTFEGVLTVMDADVLRSGLVSGFGRAKGYGCGLLTLARPRV